MIQDGAHPVTSTRDILEQLNIYVIPSDEETREQLKTISPDNAEERTLLPLLSLEACHIDELTRQSELEANTVASTLVMMENNVKFCFKKQARLQGNASYPSPTAFLLENAA